jgi:hypothetical protein
MKRGRTDQELLELIENKKMELEREKELMFSHLKIPIPKLSKEEEDILIQHIEEIIVDVFSKQYSRVEIPIFPQHVCFLNTPLYNWVSNFFGLGTSEELIFSRKWLLSELPKFAHEFVKIWNDNHEMFKMRYDNEYSLIINKKK